MKRDSVLFIGLLCSMCWTLPSRGYAQGGGDKEEDGWPRLKLTTPPFGLVNIQWMIGKGVGRPAITQRAFDSLNLKERFTYTMIHPESYVQNCGRPYNPRGYQRDLFNHVPLFFMGEYTWSQRQRDFLKDNKASVISMMEETIAKGMGIGANYKRAIVIIGAVEMIPTLILVYDKEPRPARKDHDLLTTMMQLMVEAKYESFLTSALYARVFTDTSNTGVYQGGDDETVKAFASEFYRRYQNLHNPRGWSRMEMSIPRYGLARVRRLIEDEDLRVRQEGEEKRKERLKKKKAKAEKPGNGQVASKDHDEDDEDWFDMAKPNRLPDSVYALLDLREKFTYAMMHPESYSQNCADFSSGGRLATTIYFKLPVFFDGNTSWSRRQADVFSNNRDSAIAWMREGIGLTGVVGLNYKMAIIDLKAGELIPVLITAYKSVDDPSKRDHDILTLLIELMSKDHYAPWLSSAIYKDFEAVGGRIWIRTIDFTAAREAAIKELAMNYYKTLNK